MVRGKVPQDVRPTARAGRGGAQDPKPRRRPVELRADLPVHKAAHVALIEVGWRNWLTAIDRGLIASAKPGGKMNRTAMNQFQRALIEAGRLADAVQALLRRMNVDSEEELEQIVNAYRLAQRAEPEDNLEMACMVIDAHLKEKPEDREQLLRRFGGIVKEAPSA